MLFNYIFFEREYIERNNENKKVKNLDKTDSLKSSDINLFLDDYKQGRAGRQYVKSKSTVVQMEERITVFCYFLANNYKMKYIKQSNFKIVTKQVRLHGRLAEVTAIQSPFTVIYPHEKEKQRLESVSFYVVVELIKLATEFKPIMSYYSLVSLCWN